MSGCREDIHSLHAELIHKARDIQFQINYDNNGNPASITCIGEKNVQFALESFFSKNGLPIKNELPVGIKNNVNLTYIVVDEYIPGSLEVFLSGTKLNGNQADPDRDYDEDPINSMFVIRLDVEKRFRLNAPPQQDEGLYVNYSKRITFNTKGGT